MSYITEFTFMLPLRGEIDRRARLIDALHNTIAELGCREAIDLTLRGREPGTIEEDMAYLKAHPVHSFIGDLIDYLLKYTPSGDVVTPLDDSPYGPARQFLVFATEINHSFLAHGMGDEPESPMILTFIKEVARAGLLEDGDSAMLITTGEHQEDSTLYSLTWNEPKDAVDVSVTQIPFRWEALL